MHKKIRTGVPLYCTRERLRVPLTRRRICTRGSVSNTCLRAGETLRERGSGGEEVLPRDRRSSPAGETPFRRRQLDRARRASISQRRASIFCFFCFFLTKTRERRLLWFRGRAYFRGSFGDRANRSQKVVGADPRTLWPNPSPLLLFFLFFFVFCVRRTDRYQNPVPDESFCCSDIYILWVSKLRKKKKDGW